MKAKSLIALLAAGLFSFLLQAQPGVIKETKLTHFKLQSSALIKESGPILSTSAYQENVYWFPVIVPSTVLTGLVANHVYPDPYQGMNNMLIPDASDEFNKQYGLEKFSHLPGDPNPWKKPYWYRTEFNVPESDKGRHFQLIFKGINYRAAVWLNGQLVADSTHMAGMFAEHFLDVSPMIKSGAANYVAVKIYPLDYPGLPSQEQLKALDDFFPNGGPTGDIGKNVTMLCSVGWDWMPPVRDRNIGIWQPVFLRTTGDVTLEQPKIVTDLPALPDTSVAHISIKFDVHNHSTQAVRGKLKIIIEPDNFTGPPIQITQDVVLPPVARKSIQLNAKQVAELIIKNPKLWWPIGYGKANLYRLKLEFESVAGTTDRSITTFGIRTVSSKAVELKSSVRRDFYVNGQRVHLVGGAWVPDMMLNTDSVRYDRELRLVKDANLNLVRIWGGGITPPDVFFDLADRYGLMVWSDFWVTGDTQGEFKGSPDWPLQSHVFINNMTNTIYRIRNHASLLVWTGGNEGHARKELYDAMRDSVIAIDGTRPFIPSSSGFAKPPASWKASWPDDKPSGVYSGGPYTWKDPKVYYELVDKSPDWVFKDETGIPSQPTYTTLPKIIPNLVWDTSLPFPLNNTWGYHDAASGNGHYELYYEEMVKRFGKPTGMEEFSNKMQFMNAMGYQGIFEAPQYKLNDTGGVMLWKLNTAFPSVIWQIYDWYLSPNAGYYFIRNSCSPVHAQLNRNDFSIDVVNRTYKAKTDLFVSAEIFKLDGQSVFRDSGKLTLTPSQVKKWISLGTQLNNADEVYIILLKVKDVAGNTLSQNTYWTNSKNDFAAMNSMSTVEVEAGVVKSWTDGNDQVKTVKLSNKGNQVAFFVRLQWTVHGEEVLPAYWSDNYITLAPGEERTLTVRTPEKAAASGGILVEGWNVKRLLIR